MHRITEHHHFIGGKLAQQVFMLLDERRLLHRIQLA
jgi:hypothetical protein